MARACNVRYRAHILCQKQYENEKSMYTDSMWLIANPKTRRLDEPMETLWKYGMSVVSNIRRL